MDWDLELRKRKRFETVIARLQKKMKEKRSLFYASKVFPELTLGWILSRETEVVRECMKLARDSNAVEILHECVDVSISGKVRRFYITSWPERILQMVMAQILTEANEQLLSEHVFSFRTGMSNLSALEALTDYFRAHPSDHYYVLKRDISKYGDSIPQEPLLQFVTGVHRLPQDSRFYHLLRESVRAQYLSPGAPEKKQILEKGIPTGSPLVPPLENLYLLPLDQRLSKLSNSFYGRYGDDFIFVTPSIEIARDADRVIETTVRELGLEMKAEKHLNYVLCKNPGDASLARGAPENFRLVRGLDWLGFRVNHDTRIGIKSTHYRGLRSHIRKNISELIRKAPAFSESKPLQFRLQLVENGLCHFLNPSNVPKLDLLLRIGHQEKLIRELDQNLVQFIVREFQSQWRLKPRESWRAFRQMKYPALLHHYVNRYGKGKDASKSTPA